ncbi:formyltransferase family protein [Tissierella sp.]|uniref:formyltransferase family protein n=1 Tax=Tissierella sp. TaxID=41274 RepID=UPI0028AB91B0|nr:formyltransferase family protein [Tissierella sp.]
MRILLIGSVKSSEVLLQKLIDMKENIVGVVTNITPNLNSDYVDLSELCIYNNIELMKADNINDVNSIEFIRDKNPDIIYCFGFSQLLSKEIINIPKKGVIGFHPTKLPLNRGRHPLIWTMALGLKETASTFFFINEGADGGDIISQEIVPIYYEDDVMGLYNRMLKMAQKQVEKLTNEIKKGNIVRIKQDDTKANCWRKRYKEDGKIDWRMSSYNIYNLVRALTRPYVGAHFAYKSKDIKVWKVKERIIEGIDNIEPGKVLEVLNDGTFTVKTGSNCIQVLDSDAIEIEVGDYL